MPLRERDLSANQVDSERTARSTSTSIYSAASPLGSGVVGLGWT